MNKKYLSLIAIAIVSVLLVGCGGTFGTIDSYDKISKAIESGKSVICTISMASEELETPMDMQYWVKGDDMRIEAKINGMDSVVVEKGSMSYMVPQAMFGGTSDCDWMAMDNSDDYNEESDDEDDYGIEQYENDPAYDIKCVVKSFGNDIFDTPGKVCTEDDIMKNMMGGFGMEGIDMDAFME